MRSAGIRVVIPQIILPIYFQIVEWVPLYPWNDLADGNSQQPLWQRIWSLRIAVALYGIWFVLQVANWWVPYFFRST
ncbi:MAG: hypothetical protein K6T81_19990 [Alicyclobacillus macrosporangiidus]|uniref:hypothetical protein n=1 Tax=Alicyclobacillus macrosporangiidus TaxID=392015 RepID=UPI0026EA6178|nr:hypothetical protein [Alicyclobacillus macrosporangiidus]MCL6600992.1 hypothetical protein [Alicyclobacillus macrosporangiidus]